VLKRSSLAGAFLPLMMLPGFAQDAQVAVAANFTAVAEELAAAFEAETGQRIGLSFGATGQLYTQITQGAPFAALLAADAERPARLVEDGIGVPDSVFTYAVGRLALYSAEDDAELGAETLEGDFTALSIADPTAAPYGAAALETIEALGLAEELTDRLVTGQNIAQAFQFVSTGNAEYGFVALSQVIEAESGSYWLVPEDLHSPILQDAVVIAGAPGEEVAQAFLDYLRSADAVAVIESYGYSVTAQ